MRLKEGLYVAITDMGLSVGIAHIDFKSRVVGVAVNNSKDVNKFAEMNAYFNNM